jgi:hypothetical protein
MVPWFYKYIAHGTLYTINIFLSPRGSSVGWGPCLMKRRSLVRIPLLLLCEHVKKKINIFCTIYIYIYYFKVFFLKKNCWDGQPPPKAKSYFFFLTLALEGGQTTPNGHRGGSATPKNGCGPKATPIIFFFLKRIH